MKIFDQGLAEVVVGSCCDDADEILYVEILVNRLLWRPLSEDLVDPSLVTCTVLVRRSCGDRGDILAKRSFH